MFNLTTLSKPAIYLVIHVIYKFYIPSIQLNFMFKI